MRWIKIKIDQNNQLLVTTCTPLAFLHQQHRGMFLIRWMRIAAINWEKVFYCTGGKKSFILMSISTFVCLISHANFTSGASKALFVCSLRMSSFQQLSSHIWWSKSCENILGATSACWQLKILRIKPSAPQRWVSILTCGQRVLFSEVTKLFAFPTLFSHCSVSSSFFF